MRGVNSQVYRALALALLVAGCRLPDEPRELNDDLTQPEINALLINLEKPKWTWDEVAGPQATGIRANVYNGSDRVLSSNLGDKFNDASEQASLFIAKGGSGAVEWRDPDGVWREAGLAQLVEGIKPVVLKPARNYALSALLRDTPRTGLYRLRVDFIDALDGLRYTDYSGVFEIR